MSEQDVFGPALPPGLSKNTLSGEQSNNDEQVEKESCEYGPTLPPGMSKNAPETELNNDVASDQNDAFEYGPALPPGFIKSSPVVVGPSLPRACANSDSSDDEIIGPLPPSKSDQFDSKTIIAHEFENRSVSMKDKLTGDGKPKKLEREEWMLELPPVLQGFGMGPRQFRAKPVEIGDRSGWTETPGDKNKPKKSKALSAQSVKEMYAKESDLEVRKALSSFEEEGRKESLYSMHNKERKRKLKEEKETGPTRKPFDRDTDLNVRQFDKAMKKQKLKSDLSSRFSHGETSATFL
ncbi:GPALPP motifs-containing protein 1-like [Ciona intestinalis]